MVNTEVMELQSPASPSPSSRSNLSLVRVRARSLVLATALALVATVALASQSAAPTASAATESRAGVPVRGAEWFALGANVPFVKWRCDFGCGAGGGVRGTEATTDRMLRDMSRRGVRVVRWYLFPDDAWQVRRGDDGTPTAVAAAALRDLDVAERLARKHDLALLPVVLPSPERVPVTWFTDPVQTAALVEALRPVVTRYQSSPHVLGWELVTGAEGLVDAGLITAEQLRLHAGQLATMANLAGSQLAIAGPQDISRIDSYTGLGFDTYTPHGMSGQVGERCATCRSRRVLTTTEGADAPVIIGAFDASSTASASRKLNRFAASGYAGAIAWSWRSTPHPAQPAAPSTVQRTALWRYLYSHPKAGPRTRTLNPCAGPSSGLYRCPNLRMRTPFNLSLGRRDGRSILYSANSLDSVGAGPASLRGRKRAGDARFEMGANQLLHRRRGAPVQVDTGAELLFKAIPGQYRYWKWNGAARMELWRLDSTGRAVERTRVGPKTVYCLRDLERTRGSLPRSPRGRVYPACSQRATQRAVTLGTSVGWSDVYPASYYENWIDVTGLRGCFAYVHVADPTNAIYESNEDDNRSNVVVRLPFRNSNDGCPGAKALPTSGTTGIY
ncbi:MAG: hypothetical protein JWO69_148 [Thermoleophilia bacterium]|nr:hypothetical protein [Thermoleophilia bacterium]